MPRKPTKSEDRPHPHLFRIVDEMLDSACQQVTEEGGALSCQKGCDYCCHLLIEISWEEATELSLWLAKQEPERQNRVLAEIVSNAARAIEIFSTHKKSRPFMQPTTGEVDLPEKIYDNYFYCEDPAPCPMLEDGVCSAYEARPTPCRLHMVSSPARNCAPDMQDADDYVVPEPLEEVKEDIGGVIAALERDGRWGHFSVVLQSNIIELADQGVIPRELGQKLTKLKKEFRKNAA